MVPSEFTSRLPRRRPSPAQTFLLYSSFLPIGLAVLWLLRSTKPIRNALLHLLPICLLFMSIWLLFKLYGLIPWGYVRELRGWFAATYFPSVDLQQLCDSYHNQGELDLPRELVNEIMRYSDLRTLKRCSLTSRAFYSAARPLIHRRVVLGRSSVIHGSPWSEPSRETYFDQAEVFHARHLSAVEERGLIRYGYVQEVYLDLKVGNPEKVLQLQQLRALETVHTLTIDSLTLDKILPVFNRCFSQFVPTVRSLSLQKTDNLQHHWYGEFVCRFPHLNDLALINPYDAERILGLSDALPRSEGLRPQQPFPLGGHLTLSGKGPLVQCLLDFPSSIHFHSIEASSRLQDLAKLLRACSFTLEVLSIRCFDNYLPPGQRLRETSVGQGSQEMVSVSLGYNGILRRLEIAVDFAELDILPPFIHKALASISSPHFSEFFLRLTQGKFGFGHNGGNPGRGISWGTGWEVVDKELCAFAAGRDDFRFGVQILTGKSTEAEVEALFPRIKSKRALVVTQQKPWW